MCFWDIHQCEPLSPSNGEYDFNGPISPNLDPFAIRLVVISGI